MSVYRILGGCWDRIQFLEPKFPFLDTTVEYIIWPLAVKTECWGSLVTHVSELPAQWPWGISTNTSHLLGLRQTSLPALVISWCEITCDVILEGDLCRAMSWTRWCLCVLSKLRVLYNSVKLKLPVLFDAELWWTLKRRYFNVRQNPAPRIHSVFNMRSLCWDLII